MRWFQSDGGRALPLGLVDGKASGTRLASAATPHMAWSVIVRTSRVSRRTIEPNSSKQTGRHSRPHVRRQRYKQPIWRRTPGALAHRKATASQWWPCRVRSLIRRNCANSTRNSGSTPRRTGAQARKCSMQMLACTGKSWRRKMPRKEKTRLVSGDLDDQAKPSTKSQAGAPQGNGFGNASTLFSKEIKTRRNSLGDTRRQTYDIDEVFTQHVTGKINVVPGQRRQLRNVSLQSESTPSVRNQLHVSS